MHQQPEADRPGDAQLSPDQRQVPAGHSHPPTCRATVTKPTPAGPNGAPRPRCSSTWREARFTTRSTSPSAAATTTEAVQRDCLEGGHRGVPLPVGYQRRLGRLPEFGTDTTLHQQLPWQRRHHQPAGLERDAEPGRLWGCQPDPLNIAGGNPGCSGLLDGLFCYWLPSASPTSSTARHRQSPTPSHWLGILRDCRCKSAK